MTPTATTEFDCEVREVFSGDDLIALIDLGVENLWKKQRIRLSGVDTPTAINAAGDTEAGKLRSYVRTLTRHRKAKLRIISRNASSMVVVLLIESPEGWINVNDILIERGYQFKTKVTPTC